MKQQSPIGKIDAVRDNERMKIEGGNQNGSVIRSLNRNSASKQPLYLPSQKPERNELKLRAIQEEEEDREREASYYERRDEGIWTRIKRCWGESSCCQRPQRNVNLSGAW